MIYFSTNPLPRCPFASTIVPGPVTVLLIPIEFPADEKSSGNLSGAQAEAFTDVFF